jgi:dTDP-4-amino-4,6-dideoxygalactose transaminase
LADLNYDEAEEKAVLDVLRSRWLTMGSVTQAFENEFAALVKTRHALAVSNATVALHLACLAVGVGPGDEVIVPSLSFVATANAILYAGAEVRFADILGPHDLTIDPVSVASQITPRTKAIIVMHYGGYPCQMPAILAIAREHGLAVIEDAAHSPGAWLDGTHLGTLGDVGCFSFFSNKNLSTGEGGMLVTERPELAEKLRLMRSHGMTSLTWDRHQGHAYSYDVVELGYNYRIDEIHSALGREQLRKLEAGNARRREITHFYWQELERASLPKDHVLDLPFHEQSGNPAIQPAHHIFPLLLPEKADRKAFIDRLRQAGIQTSIHYPPIHKFSFYQQRYAGKIQSLPLTESVAAREVTLPLYPGMTHAMIELVLDETLRALRAGVESPRANLIPL